MRYLFEEEFTVGIQEDVTTLPTNFFLQQNFPNPFNPITTIEYEIPKRSDVQIIIYDILGRKVTTLISETQEVGYKSIEWNASRAASGMYFYQIRAGKFVQTRKMVLLK
ncbi:MAG: T9SS type A sorting domain-containing protein [Candidatus Marinimicrobia bacterium]|nr:T9SS type A sorting domain-containing protein [Candidatus Neomarinimicrobiota bacterium]